MKMLHCIVAVAALATGVLYGNDEVKVSKFGYDPVDSTRFIQAALDSGAKRVVLDRQSGPWNTLTLHMRSGVEFVLEPGVELVAKRGEFKGLRDYLFLVDGVTNAVIRGGEGSAFRMWKADYQGPDYAHGEWRYALKITRSANILVEGLRLCDSGGDGIGVSGKNITIRKCVCDNNHRQGISVFSVENLLIEDTVLSNTKGTPPAAGIDFEPDRNHWLMSNVMMRNCLLENNTGSGIEIYLARLESDSEPISMRFENCRMVGNSSSMVIDPGPRGHNHVGGKIEVKGCSFISPNRNGISIRHKTDEAFDVSFSDCVISNAPTAVALTVGGNDMSGPPDGIDFGNLTVMQNSDKPWFKLNRQGFGPAAKRMAGEVKVIAADGSCKTDSIDADWVGRNMPVINGGMMPLPRAGYPDAKSVKIVDTKPGELVDLSPMTVVQRNRQYLFFAEKGEVRFVGRQVIAVKGRKPGTKEISIRPVLGNGKLGKSVSVAIPSDKSSEIVFTAPKRGFYVMSIPKTKTRFLLEKSSVPVAVDVCDGSATVAGLRGKPFSLWVPTQDGKRFQAFLSGSDYYRFAFSIKDGTGKTRHECSLVDDLRMFDSGEDVTAGLWRFDFSKAKEPNYDFIDIDLVGISGVFFLSTEKHW